MRSAQESVHLVAASAGFVSFFLLWLATVWGLVLRNGWMLARLRHSTVYSIHMTLALFGLSLGVVHAAAQLAAPGGPVRLVDEFVPFINPTDPIGIGVGVIGLELLLAVTGSLVVQRLLGYSRWRAVHALAYAAFMLVAAHTLISGSDVGPVWVWGPVLACGLVTVVLWLTTTPYLDNVHRGLLARMTGAKAGPETTVNVDARKCARFGFCEHEAPDVFRLRGDGRLSYRASVPDEQTEAVLRAVEVCPARAIVLGQTPTTVLTPQPETPVEEPTGAGAVMTGGGTVTGLHRRRVPR